MSLIATSYLQTFICPITGDIMKDPVIGSDGHTYERSAIEQWLHTPDAHGRLCDRSPATSNIKK